MTWIEFKDYVDKQLKLKRIDENVEISYIYVHMPTIGYFDVSVGCDVVDCNEHKHTMSIG